jgi:C-terminal processing protease CtpA/Prc
VPATRPVEPGEGRAVALKLADELVSNFVYRDQAEAYAAMLRKNAAAGRYNTGTRGDVAKRMTDDLLAVHKDGHLTVNVAEPEQAAGGRDGGPNFPPPIQSAKTIAPGVGYIRFTAFIGTDEEVAGVRKWLAENRDARTLIFDLRNHHGGGLDEQDAIFSCLYAKPTPLVRMAMATSIFEKFGSPMGNSPTLKFVAEGTRVIATHSAIPGADTPLRNARVYLLISNKTASAAEHFSLAMKSTGRATLIGEATAGANHFGGPAPLDDHFTVWMPIGRTYDIKTGKDWEGNGVAPDIAIDPRQALVVALEKAGLSHAEAVRLNEQEIPAEPVHADKVRAR